MPVIDGPSSSVSRRISIITLKRVRRTDSLRDPDFFTSIGEGHTIGILLALNESGTPLILKDLMPIVNHTQTLRKRLESMRDDGLIEMTDSRDGHKRILVSLTPLGKEAAFLFSMVDLLVSPGSELSGKSIDRKHAETVFLILDGKDYVVQKEILTHIRNHEYVTRLLNLMLDEGLVLITDSVEGRHEKRYSLTPLGKRVSEVYRCINERILSIS